MAVYYSIQAQIVDIRDDSPIPSDSFLVDTNVWYWLTYTRASGCYAPPAQYQITHYPAYTNSVLNAGAKIFQCGLSLAELSHLIEKSEREIYARLHGDVKNKEYRHNYPMERQQVCAEINAACCQVINLADPLALTIDAGTISAVLNSVQVVKLDGYDMFLIEAMKNNDIVQILTDDGDFTTVPGIQVYTANENVVSSARMQGKLLKR